MPKTTASTDSTGARTARASPWTPPVAPWPSGPPRPYGWRFRLPDLHNPLVTPPLTPHELAQIATFQTVQLRSLDVAAATDHSTSQQVKCGQGFKLKRLWNKRHVGDRVAESNPSLPVWAKSALAKEEWCQKWDKLRKKRQKRTVTSLAQQQWAVAMQAQERLLHAPHSSLKYEHLNSVRAREQQQGASSSLRTSTPAAAVPARCRTPQFPPTPPPTPVTAPSMASGTAGSVRPILPKSPHLALLQTWDVSMKEAVTRLLHDLPSTSAQTRRGESGIGRWNSDSSLELSRKDSREESCVQPVGTVSSAPVCVDICFQSEDNRGGGSVSKAQTPIWQPWRTQDVTEPVSPRKVARTRSPARRDSPKKTKARESKTPKKEHHWACNQTHEVGHVCRAVSHRCENCGAIGHVPESLYCLKGNGSESTERVEPVVVVNRAQVIPKSQYLLANKKSKLGANTTVGMDGTQGNRNDEDEIGFGRLIIDETADLSPPALRTASQ